MGDEYYYDVTGRRVKKGSRGAVPEKGEYYSWEDFEDKSSRDQYGWHDWAVREARGGMTPEEIRNALARSGLSRENQLEIMLKLSPESKSRQDAYDTFISQRDWNREFAPEAQRYGDLLEEQARRATAKAIADRRMQAGYLESSGRGGGGYWNSVGVALMTGGMTAQAKAAQTSEKFQEQMYNKYMTQQDLEAHKEQMLNMQAEYNQWVADQNLDAASWGILGSAIGSFTGMLAGGLYGKE